MSRVGESGTVYFCRGKRCAGISVSDGAGGDRAAADCGL